MDNIELDDKLTELALYQDRAFTMVLDLMDFFSKPGTPTDRDIATIRLGFANISTKLEIAIDYLLRSRELTAEIQNTEVTNIVG